MDKSLNVFILAAGLGERLRPITNHIPKPLLPILGRPVLQHVLEKVSVLPVNKIGINLHYKKALMESWIKNSSFHERVELFPEEPALGTGGALRNAGSFLEDSTFLVHNADIVSDIDLKELVRFHHLSGNLATLYVHEHPEFNRLVINRDGFLTGVGGHCDVHSKYMAFTGIAVYSPEFLKFLPHGISSVVDAWLRAIEKGHRIGTFDVSGCYWRDIGTPSAYLTVVFEALRKEGESLYIHPSVRRCQEVNFNGYVVVEEGAILGKGVSLKNCIILPGSRTEGASCENCIVGPDFNIEFKESDLPFFSKEEDALVIGTGGSGRKYYRVRRDGRSVVIMQCGEDDPDFQRHIEYTRFFLRNSIPVPELIGIEPDRKRAIFEDLGDVSLYSWLKCPRDDEEIEEMYRKVMDMLIDLHTISPDCMRDCPSLGNGYFDYDHFRWETRYFVQRFVRDIKGMNIEDPQALNDEFHRLAIKADSFPKTLIHRDFQSQNIMITQGRPRLIDFQGARLGPPAYDLVSILWDPYHRLSDRMRESLLNYYIGKLMERIDKRPGGVDFRETILPCRLQRHMQALGAYGFLASVRGKRYFLKYIPEGLRLLKEDVALTREEYPALYRLVMRL